MLLFKHGTHHVGVEVVSAYFPLHSVLSGKKNDLVLRPCALYSHIHTRCVRCVRCFMSTHNFDVFWPLFLFSFPFVM